MQFQRIGEGAYDTVSAFGYVLLPMFPDETGLRRAKGRCPLASPTRVPLDPVRPETNFVPSCLINSPGTKAH